MPDDNHDPLEAERTQLLTALSRSREERTFTDPLIRQAARNYGRAARSAGVPPERLIIALKKLTHSPELVQIRDWFRRVMTDRVIVWAIDAYYGLDSDS